MKGLLPRNEDEREFIKVFDSLCYGQSRFQIWADFVHMFALSIVNAIDKAHFEEREKRYLRIVKPYKAADMEKFAHLARITVMALEHNPNQDFLGELYMRCDLGNDHTGQFFTPYHICELMAKIIVDGQVSAKDDIKNKGYISIVDPCIGGGAMLIGAAQALRDMGINYQQECIFVGQDIDYTVAMMAYIQLSLLGCPGYVVVGNSLTEPMTGNVLFGEGTERTYYTPMFFSEKFDFLRRIEIFKNLFYSTGAAEKPPMPQPEATVSKNETVAEEPEPTEPEPAEEQEAVPVIALEGPAVIEVSKRKGKALAGQIMFDFDL